MIEEDKVKQRQRSIGIISLWHVEQALLINRLLDEDPDISSRRDIHKIRCSDARGFQGDERDVCLLSMVVGADERRVPSTDTATYNVAVSRARFSVILFHSRSIHKLKENEENKENKQDLRLKLLSYFQRHADLSPHSNRDLWDERFEVLSSLTSQLEGYTVKPINVERGLMIQVGSDRSKASSDCNKATCIFVVLGAGTVYEWMAEQEICYMLSRLNRTWKALWLLNAIMNPTECVNEMREFLKEKKVLPSTNSAEEKPLLYGSREGGESGRGGQNERGGAVGGQRGEGCTGDQATKRKFDSKEAAVVAILDTTIEDSSEGPSRGLIPPANTTSDPSLPAHLHAEQPEIAKETGAFESQHLACVLSAAFGTLKNITELLKYIKTQSDVFKKGVPLRAKSGGSTYNKAPQIAESIAKCRPDGVTTAHELLSWLTVSAAK